MSKLQNRFVKIFGLALVFLASIGFVVVGMGDFQFGVRSAKVAEVDGHDIDQTQWDNAHRADMDRMLSANPDLSLNVLDSPAMKYAALQRLVRDYVLSAAAQHEHLTVSDARLAAALQADPGIAALRDADGKLDMARYKSLLAAQGMTPAGFEAGLRADLERQQVLSGILDSDIASDAQIDASMNALRERREASIVHFSTHEYGAKLDPTEQQLQDYYEQHIAQYQAPESVDIQYLVLDLESIKKGIQINDEDLRKYYEQNAAALGTPEERSVRHILVAVAKDATAQQREDAKAKATKLLDEVRAHPDRFAEVARESSDDSASAASGGELGFFQADKGMDPAIAKAAFDLGKVGDIDDSLVSSDFGYHIVQLSGIKPAEVPPFESVQAKLEDQFRTQEAQRKFTEAAEEFTNSVYEQAGSLEPAAQKLGLTIQTADDVTRTPAAGATGPLASAKFLEALFSVDAIDNKHNTEAIETGPNQLASGRVTQHTAAHARPFEEVQTAVREQWMDTQGAQKAQAAGTQQLKAWQAQPASAKDLPAPVVISRQEARSEPAALVEAIMRANPAKLPAFVGVDLGGDGYAIARVDKVLAPEAETPEEAAQTRALYEQLWVAAEAQSQYDWLKTRYKVKILVPAPSAASAPAEP